MKSKFYRIMKIRVSNLIDETEFLKNELRSKDTIIKLIIEVQNIITNKVEIFWKLILLY